MTRDRDLGSAEPYPGLSGRIVRRRNAQVCYVDSRRLRHWWLLVKTLTRRRFDLLYVNSFWAPSSLLSVLGVRTGLIRARRILVAPRGELAASALDCKSTKKSLFLPLWRPFLRRRDVLWHATCEAEAEAVRRIFREAHVHVSRTKVALPPEPLPPTLNDGPLRLVFISRIHPIKGLDIALAALEQVTGRIVLDIYGPIEDRAYWAVCQDLIRRLPRSVTVSYRGVLAPDQVRTALAGYDAFVFPTKGENFGHIIAESLSASCPVICADRTPWTPVIQAGGGELLNDLDVQTLARHLDVLATATPEQWLHKRRAAGDAYRGWRAGDTGANLLDQIRLAGGG
ncbi:glycosyltransferase [Verrucosispora sp. WMMD573]|nr:glycosyltransferase [Verrucosispora sp. WMMD573]WBB52103.1 glycosyltransferase [Verrucosispora sp. WMMD573]